MLEIRMFEKPKLSNGSSLELSDEVKSALVRRSGSSCVLNQGLYRKLLKSSYALSVTLSLNVIGRVHQLSQCRRISNIIGHIGIASLPEGKNELVKFSCINVP